MRAVFLLLAGLVMAGCARERAGVLVKSAAKGPSVGVAGAEVFVVKKTAEETILAPARDAAAKKKREVDERFRPELAALEARLTTAMEAQTKTPPGKVAAPVVVGADTKRNGAMEALMGKQKEFFLAKLAVREAAYEVARRGLALPAATVTKADGGFTVKLGSDDVVLALDAKTKTVWRAEAGAFDSALTTVDEGFMVAFP